MKAWVPLFKMYDAEPEPTWEALRRVPKGLQRWWAERPDKIDEKGLQTEIKGRLADKAGGTDGWRTAEHNYCPAYHSRPDSKSLKQ